MFRGLILFCLLAASARADCVGATSSGDPITTFDGVSTRYWLKNGTETELFRSGDIALLGTAGPTPGYDKSVGEWLHSARLIKAGETVLHVAINHAAGLNKSRNDKTGLRSLNVRLGDAALTGSGKAESGGVSVSVEVDSAHEVPVEALRVTVGDELGLVIRSSVARKFADKAEQARHIHLDLEWTHIKRKEAARGMLPEIWGLAPMSAATKIALVQPSGRRLDECPGNLDEDADFFKFPADELEDTACGRLGGPYDVSGNCRIPLFKMPPDCTDAMLLEQVACIKTKTNPTIVSYGPNLVDDQDSLKELVSGMASIEGGGWGGHASASVTAVQSSKMSSESISVTTGEGKVTRTSWIQNPENLELTDEELFKKQLKSKWAFSICSKGKRVAWCTV